MTDCSITDRRRDIFLFTTTSSSALGPHPASYLMSKEGISLGVKWPEREADHPPPCSAKVKKAWSNTSISPYVFTAWYLVKHSDNFTLHSTV
jgi:hypothetical protein